MPQQTHNEAFHDTVIETVTLTLHDTIRETTTITIQTNNDGDTTKLTTTRDREKSTTRDRTANHTHHTTQTERDSTTKETTTTPIQPISPIPTILAYFGGFEMVAAIGAMLRAAELRMIILVDGFIMTACALAAIQLRPEVKDFMIFAHCGDESGHKRMLDAMGANFLLSLGLRLGEGTGALCAYPIVDSAVRMINEMNNFQNANITKYF